MEAKWEQRTDCLWTLCSEAFVYHAGVILDGGEACAIDPGLLPQEIDAISGFIEERGAALATIALTHAHWDHVLGFPFLDPIYDPTSKIAIDGLPACIKGLKIPFDNRMGDGFWPVKFDDLKAQILFLDTLRHGPLRIDSAVIDTIPLQHPQGGVGFRFREGEKTLVFLTDNELKEDAWPGRSSEDFVRFCSLPPAGVYCRRGRERSVWIPLHRQRLEALRVRPCWADDWAPEPR